MFLEFDTPLGASADVTVWVRNRDGKWVITDRFLGAEHREEYTTMRVRGRPVYFQIESATTDGDIFFSPA